jgi:DTW domain-containing protein
MINNKIPVIVLRHPQEEDAKLGTAKILVETLSNVKIITGLSWPNFEKVIGSKEDPKRWGILYLGSAVLPEAKDLYCLNRKGEIIEDAQIIKRALKGIVVIDGTWSQAKSLWWRNPWVLKLQRLAVQPFMPSLYGKLRKEPRRESVSSLEAVAACLTELGEPVSTSKALISNFRAMLEEYRKEVKESPKPAASKFRKPTRDRRNRKKTVPAKKA